MPDILEKILDVKRGEISLAKQQRPLAALLILSGLNFFNYVDRSVLFAVLPLSFRVGLNCAVWPGAASSVPEASR